MPCDNAIIDLIQHKTVHLPYSHTVNIYSSEVILNPETDACLPLSLWTLPPSLDREAESAGVELKGVAWTSGSSTFRENRRF